VKKPLPQITIEVRDAESNLAITDQSVYVSIAQDKFLEGFKEIARSRPNPTNGTVRFEATSLTKYRVVGDGTRYDSNEKIIDTGFNFLAPVNEILYLRRKLVPTPDLDIGHWTRDIGLAQIAPLLIFVIAGAVIVGGIVWGISKVGLVAKAKKKIEAKKE
jgi:hypothetical protein